MQPIFAAFTAFDHQELVEKGSGLLELVLLTALIFAVALPIFVVHAILRKQAAKSAVESAGHFATKAAIALFAGLPVCAIVLGLPFGVLNVIGLTVFGQQLYWPLILPGLFVVYSLMGLAFWSVQSERRQNADLQKRRKRKRNRT